ncbi:hypothetical protein LGK97_08030 [Clostridium sp. CS001]|uniref:hypothetical protein n=1 Tax=Clostridium sp. CS001 TaxID=2880648 RepID=UPI001CF591B3|nr:hypothetical protein [Clostridium sp. CS001]MCB2289711.1 hypothetical protein [Clostridium sp. CS001]
MNNEEKNKFLAKQVISLSKVNELHKQLKDIDGSLSKLYPITIVEDDTFFVFDLDVTGEKYEFKLEYPTPMQISKGVLAAFQLEFYNMKSSAIVSDDVFDSLEGYVFIFHEFVHCFQCENCESELRETLEIERKSRKENNFMWEINYSFPYENPIFIEKTMELDNYFNTRDYNRVSNYHKEIRGYLNKIDFEYMVWQEWKEGFARYIENLIRDRLGINRNTNKLQKPFDRVCFYEIGSKYIDLLIDVNAELKYNIKDLYYKMANLG